MAKKTEAVGMRFDERTRYALELLSRKRHRSYAGVVTDLITVAASNELSPSFEELWAPDAPSRFLNLIEKAPALMDHDDEMAFLKLVLHGEMFHPVPESYGPDDMERDEIGPSMRLIDSPKGKFLVDLYKLLECWDLISDFASGKLTLAELDRAYVERLFGTDVPQSETFDEYVLRLKKRWDARGS